MIMIVIVIIIIIISITAWYVKNMHYSKRETVVAYQA